MIEIILETTRKEIVTKGKQKIKAKYDKKINDIKDKREDYIETLKDKAQDKGRDISDDLEEDLWNKRRFYAAALSDRMKKLLKLRDQEIDAFVKRTTKMTPKQIVVVVSAGTLIALSYQTANVIKKHSYDVCFKIKDSQERSVCAKRYEYEFYKKRLVYLKDNITRCKFSKDPIACNKRIYKEMLTIKDKLVEIRTEMLKKYAGVKS